MKTTAEFLDALRAHLGLPSDNRLAQYMGIKRQQLGRYRSMKETFGDEMSRKVAELLGVDPAYVMVCMATQRAKGETREAWMRLAAKLAATTSAALFSVAMLLAPAPSPAAQLVGDHCVLC